VNRWFAPEDLPTALGSLLVTDAERNDSEVAPLIVARISSSTKPVIETSDTQEMATLSQSRWPFCFLSMLLLLGF